MRGAAPRSSASPPRASSPATWSSEPLDPAAATALVTECRTRPAHLPIREPGVLEVLRLAEYLLPNCRLPPLAGPVRHSVKFSCQTADLHRPSWSAPRPPRPPRPPR